MDAETKLALAHALRTPLTSLALGLGLLDEGALGLLSEAQREVVRVLVADVARLSLLVDSELSLDRLGAHAGPVEQTPAELDALVQRALGPLAQQAEERGLALDLTLAPGVTVVVDPVKMGWVVATLLGNAIRYSPRSGHIAVSLAQRGDEAEIAVTDEGPGMDAEVAGRLFDRGGGLSLFLVREVVEAHGGRIIVDSAPGRGSTFTVRLPAGTRESRAYGQRG